MKASVESVIRSSAAIRKPRRAPYLVSALLIVGCATTSAPVKKEAATVSGCTSIDACVTYVRETISIQWIRPSEFTYPSKVRLKVVLDSNAAVQRVDVAASSGNALFDRSAVEAVQRAKGFPGLQGLDSKMFENFKQFFFDFSPHANLGLARPDRAAYDAAFQLLKSEKYNEAAAAFSAFVEKYPTSAYIDYGFFWLGDTCYVLKDYVRAAAAFQTVLAKYRLSRKVPNSLLRLGDISYGLQEFDAARKYFERLINEYASTEAAEIGLQRLAKMKSEGR